MDLNKKFVLVIVILTVFLGLVYLFISPPKKQSDELDSEESSCADSQYNNVIYINSTEICAGIVDTPETMIKGLSEREYLGENQGMFFVFSGKSMPRFWMKDMKFPIDIIWIADNEIVDISKNVSAPDENQSSSQLPRYSPSKPVNYVLEVNAGYSENNHIEIGDKVIFN